MRKICLTIAFLSLFANLYAQDQDYKIFGRIEGENTVNGSERIRQSKHVNRLAGFLTDLEQKIQKQNMINYPTAF